MSSRLERRAAVAAWRRSGLSAGVFAPRLGISVPTLYAWSRGVGSGRGNGSGRRAGGRPRLVELVPASEGTGAALRDAAPTRAGGAAASIEIELTGGRRVRVGPGFDDEHLRRVIAVAESA